MSYPWLIHVNVFLWVLIYRSNDSNKFKKNLSVAYVKECWTEFDNSKSSCHSVLYDELMRQLDYQNDVLIVQ